MKFYVNSTANLGDFLNVLPVLSGMAMKFQYSLIIKNEMRKFKGIKELLEYQGFCTSVHFDDEFTEELVVLPLSSWTREDQSDINSPIETCRYENFVKDVYRLDFTVDNDFILKVPELNIPVESVYYGGDRWTGPAIDSRRETSVLARFDKLKFLDFDNDMLTNAYILKHLKRPFISTFTGISVLADLLAVDQLVLWGDDIRNWDSKPIEYSFNKHFYRNRNSKLMFIDDFERDIYARLYNL